MVTVNKLGGLDLFMGQILTLTLSLLINGVLSWNEIQLIFPLSQPPTKLGGPTKDWIYFVEATYYT